MADRDRQPTDIAQLRLQLCRPNPPATPVGAACISQDQQALRRWKLPLPFARPPSNDRFDGKARPITAVTDPDKAMAVVEFIDAEQDRLADRILPEVAHPDRFRFATPCLLGILERANQVLFFVSTLMTGSAPARKSPLT